MVPILWGSWWELLAFIVIGGCRGISAVFRTTVCLWNNTASSHMFWTVTKRLGTTRDLGGSWRVWGENRAIDGAQEGSIAFTPSWKITRPGNYKLVAALRKVNRSVSPKMWGKIVSWSPSWGHQVAFFYIVFITTVFQYGDLQQGWVAGGNALLMGRYSRAIVPVDESLEAW